MLSIAQSRIARATLVAGTRGSLVFRYVGLVEHHPWEGPACALPEATWNGDVNLSGNDIGDVE